MEPFRIPEKEKTKKKEGKYSAGNNIDVEYKKEYRENQGKGD
jgi:hypothetical protein